MFPLMSCGYRGDEGFPIDYDDEVWQATATSAGADIYPTQTQQDAVTSWTASYQNIISPAEEVRQAEALLDGSDIYAQNPQAALNVWEAPPRNITSASSPMQAPREHNRDMKNVPSSSSTPGHSSPSDSTSTTRGSGRQISASSINRRRSQNRDAQRVFRARQKLQMQFLEEQVQDLIQRHGELETEYVKLDAKYRALVQKMGIQEDCNDEKAVALSGDGLARP